MKTNSKWFVIFIFSIFVSYIQVSLSNIDDSESDSNITFICPVDSGKIISTFGKRIHPVLKVERHHDGIDIKAPKGFPVYATADGVIKHAGKNGGYGNMVIITHKNGFETRYGHLENILVEFGQNVQKSEKIGTIGNTGLTTLVHLHYEIKKDSIPVDPLKLIPLYNLKH
jgi:murein DD-endopeptidase MepM/ murein hydrolase activator NlpD